MSKSRSLSLSVITAGKAAIIAAGSLAGAAQTARANDFTAGIVMERMQGPERYAYVAGVVEGLAVARYMRDGRQPQAMNCIYEWFYRGQGTIDTVYAAFQRYPNHPPGSVILVLAGQRCGQ